MQITSFYQDMSELSGARHTGKSPVVVCRCACQQCRHCNLRTNRAISEEYLVAGIKNLVGDRYTTPDQVQLCLIPHPLYYNHREAKQLFPPLRLC